MEFALDLFDLLFLFFTPISIVYIGVTHCSTKNGRKMMSFVIELLATPTQHQRTMLLFISSPFLFEYNRKDNGLYICRA